MRRILMCIGAAVLILAASAGGATAQARGGATSPGFVAGEVIVGFPRPARAAQINAALASVGGTDVAQILFPDTKVVRVRLADSTAAGTEAAVKQLRGDPALVGKIRFVEPNIIQQVHDVRQSGGATVMTQSSDPSLSEQWGYYDIGAQWVQQTGTQKLIAVLDTGVDYTHPELVGKVVKGKDFVNNDSDPRDDMGHGTHVSGIIAAKANNAFGIAGVALNAKILAVKVMNSQGYGTTFDIAKGIKYAADNSSVRVINMSLGGTYDPIEETAVRYAVITKGKLLVASAGNSNSSESTSSYPAAFSSYPDYDGKVIAVGAHDSKDCRGVWPKPDMPDIASNYGTWVDISAPGTDILSSFPGAMSPGSNGFISWDGTSMATAFVAAAAEVLWAKYPALTNSAVSGALTTTVVGLDRTTVGCWPASGDGTYGRLSLANAMTNGGICKTAMTAPYGYASDASNGEPLAGAKVQVLQGTTVKGTDYVPYYGYLTEPADGSVIAEGYGLFSVGGSFSVAPQTVDARITKSSYATYTAKALPYNSCAGSYAGTIPVPPTTGLYWVAVTTNYGQATDLLFDLIGLHPDGTEYSFDNPGDLNAYPYMKLLWDSDREDYLGSLRKYSETIRIKQLAAGTYSFYVQDWHGQQEHHNPDNTGYEGPYTPNNWSAAGMKAYIYKGSALVKEITAPGGTGEYWYIADINGSTVTEKNTYFTP